MMEKSDSMYKMFPKIQRYYFSHNEQ